MVQVRRLHTDLDVGEWNVRAVHGGHSTTQVELAEVVLVPRGHFIGRGGPHGCVEVLDEGLGNPRDGLLHSGLRHPVRVGQRQQLPTEGEVVEEHSKLVLHGLRSIGPGVVAVSTAHTRERHDTQARAPWTCMQYCTDPFVRGTLLHVHTYGEQTSSLITSARY